MTSCLFCGKDFHIYKSENKRKFCSKSCYTNYSIKNSKTKNAKCLNCNISIKIYKSRPSKKYCSRSCYLEYTKKILQKHQIIKYCKICNFKMVFKRSSDVTETCSKSCRYKLNGQRHKGNSWKMSKDGRKKISVGRKKYLSIEENLNKLRERTKNCWKNEKFRKLILTKERALKISKTEKMLYATGQLKPVHIKNSKYSKTTKYKNILFRSTWEARVAKWLDDNNIKWEYESKKCIVPLPNGSSYIIDFFLPNKQKYIEVKGWYNDYSIYKLDQAIIQGYDVCVVDKTNINNINLNIDWRTQSKFFMEINEFLGEC